MKTPHIMLSVIAVMSVIGGATAFKAKKSGDTICFYLKTSSLGQCTTSGTTTYQTTTTTDLTYIELGPTTTRVIDNVTVTQCLITGPAAYPNCLIKRAFMEE